MWNVRHTLAVYASVLRNVERIEIRLEDGYYPRGYENLGEHMREFERLKEVIFCDESKRISRDPYDRRMQFHAPIIMDFHVPVIMNGVLLESASILPGIEHLETRLKHGHVYWAYEDIKDALPDFGKLKKVVIVDENQVRTDGEWALGEAGSRRPAPTTINAREMAFAWDARSRPPRRSGERTDLAPLGYCK
ncbi:hypothetical protein LTR17_023825 [Elasticomyces elasticus]|nr:hypothetical protein LTR17_023825 [Elasticomyces elasticus]